MEPSGLCAAGAALPSLGASPPVLQEWWPLRLSFETQVTAILEMSLNVMKGH